MTVLTQTAKLLPRLFVTTSYLLGSRATREDVMQPEAEDGWLVADLEDAVGLACNAQESAFHHLPVQMLVQRVLVILESFLVATPEERPVAERQRPGLGIAMIIEQDVIHERHRLHIGTVHDVVALDRVPLLGELVGEMGVEECSAATHVAPVHPHRGMQHLLDQALERWSEDSRRRRKVVEVRQPQSVRHVSKLEPVPAKVLLVRSPPRHERPVVWRLPREVVYVTEVAKLKLVKKRQPSNVQGKRGVHAG